MIDIKIHTMLEFKTSVHLTLRKQVTLAFEKRYDRAKFHKWESICKGAMLDVERVWEQFLYENLRQLQKNPSKDLANVIISKWEMTKYSNDVIVKAVMKYLCMRLNHKSIDLGHTPAYITLYNKGTKLEKKYPKSEYPVFWWLLSQERLGQLYFKLCQNGLLDAETSLDAFKTTLNGGILADLQPINLLCTNTLKVYLFDQLDIKGFISIRATMKNKTIEKICGIKNVAQTRDNKNKSKGGEPRGHQQIDDILNEI